MLDLLSVVVSGLLTLIFAAVGSFVMWKILGPRVVVKAIQGHMGPILVEWFMTPSISTGKKRKAVDSEAEFDESGKEISPATYKEIDEVLSPLEMIISRAGEVMMTKIYGKLGGDARKRMAVQQDILAGLSSPGNAIGGMLNSINPALLNRALRDGDYMPIILEQLGPLAKQFLENKLNQGGATSGF